MQHGEILEFRGVACSWQLNSNLHIQPVHLHFSSPDFRTFGNDFVVGILRKRLNSGINLHPRLAIFLPAI